MIRTSPIFFPQPLWPKPYAAWYNGVMIFCVPLGRAGCGREREVTAYPSVHLRSYNPPQSHRSCDPLIPSLTE